MSEENHRVTGSRVSVSYPVLTRFLPRDATQSAVIRVEYSWDQEHIKGAICPKRRNIGSRLLLRTNRKSIGYALSIGAKINDLG